MKSISMLAVAAVLAAVLARASHADVICDEMIESVDQFLTRQMEWFDTIRPPGQPPLVQTFGWDTALPFPPEELNPPPSTIPPPCALAPLEELRWRGDVYDQSLAALWFTELARLDFANGRCQSENLDAWKSCLNQRVSCV